MQYKTHIVTSLAVALPVLSATGTLGAASIAAICLGSVFPDIDEPRSWIGKRTRGISDGTNKLLGHRGLTHSLLAVGIVAAVALLLAYIFQFRLSIAICFAAGYLLHLIEDSFSKSGLAWLLPFSSKRIQSGFGVIYYTTGSVIEKLFFLAMLLILIYQVIQMDFSPVVNTANAGLQGLADKIRGVEFSELVENALNGIKSFFGV